MYRFYRPETKTWEGVAPEAWEWEALYTDGTILRQYDEKYVYHQLIEVDMTKLRSFSFFSRDFPQKYILSPSFDESELVCFYRQTTQNLASKTPKKTTFYVFGYKKLTEERPKTFNIILPDGNLLVTDDIEHIGNMLE